MVREESAPGSAIVFDHLWEHVVSGPTQRYGAQKGREFVARQGEPFMFGFRQGEVAPALSALGFTLERLLEPADQLDLIRLPDGSVMGRFPRCTAWSSRVSRRPGLTWPCVRRGARQQGVDGPRTIRACVCAVARTDTSRA
jgi:hypothetical protein